MMINRKFLLATIALFAIAIMSGCNKDKFASKPSLKFKSISSYDIPNKGLFEIHLEYTDAEGDLSVANDALTIRRTVLHCIADTAKFPYPLPAIPAGKNSSGEIVIKFANNTFDFTNQGYAAYTLSAVCNFGTKPDTTTLRFYIKDKAGNVSDTISTDKPVIIRRQ